MPTFEFAGSQTNSFVVNIKADSQEEAEERFYDLDLAVHYIAESIELEYIDKMED